MIDNITLHNLILLNWGWWWAFWHDGVSWGVVFVFIWSPRLICSIIQSFGNFAGF